MESIFSHEETGNDISYKRDLRLKKFFDEANIAWHEFKSNGVIRGLRNRIDWDKKFQSFMQQELINPDLSKLNTVKLSDFELSDLGIKPLRMETSSLNLVCLQLF